MNPDHEPLTAEDEGDRPWERPGCVRRDCEPHRGPLLSNLSGAGFVLGVLSLLFVVPCVPGLLVAGPAWVLARRDLRRMRAGLMDPAGRDLTQQALTRAKVGAALNGLVLGISAAGFVASWL
jgi:hypothetical protein